MKGIFDWLLKNKVGMGLLALVVVGFAVIGGINGCKATDFVKVNAPLEVQKATGCAPKVTLTEAPRVMAAYVAAGDEFSENIATGHQWLGFITSLGSAGIEFGKANIPGGAMGLSLLSLAAGVFIKGPGTAKEKNASYNKGLEEGRRLAEAAMAAVKDSG